MNLHQPDRYKIKLSFDAKEDIKNTKRYILETFKYRETAESFSKNIKIAINKLQPFPEAYSSTGMYIEGLEVLYKPYSTYLIFFVIEANHILVVRVLKDRMYWQSIIKRITKLD
ncbi:MAG: type II toxin-antitoxin system RelE/ParE family toxin [Lachnospiraceae bacterium]|nr:type II toxin-antitoxin system RelE/ParE family toxin [Lachnospiraceae bacterium]